MIRELSNQMRIRDRFSHLAKAVINPIRSSTWLQEQAWLYSALRACFRAALHLITLNRGVSKVIGTAGEYRFDHAFLYWDFADWGIKHNNGFGLLLKMCEGKTTIFDVGAHIGLYSLPIASVMGPYGTVYAFEAADGNVRYLQSNAAKNNFDNIKVVNTLIGDETKDGIVFYEARDIDGMNSIAIPRKRTKRYSKTLKNQVAIDDFCTSHGLKPSLIKIDVEGAEIAVLKGASLILRECRPLIFLSFHPQQVQDLGESTKSLYNIASEHSYSLLNVDGTNVTELGLEEYLFFPTEKFSEICEIVSRS